MEPRWLGLEAFWRIGRSWMRPTKLFADQGIDATSMDGIAAASGVSKATIYKHWPDKEKLALEVLSYVHGLDKEVPVFNSGDTRADLIAQLNYQPAPDRSENKGTASCRT